MPDIDKIIKAIKCRNGIDDTDSCTGCHYFVEEDNKLHHVYCNYQQLLNDVIDALELLKEREERLRKLQKDKDKLCLEVSEWKHKFHDAPPKFVSQGVVDQICWERDTALSQLEQIGKGLGSKMDDIVALLKEQEAVVRCKDCKHKEESISPSWEAWCNRLHCGCDLDWFCADGERK